MANRVGAKTTITDVEQAEWITGTASGEKFGLDVNVLAGGASGLTDAELRASPLEVTGEFSVEGGGDASAENQLLILAEAEDVNAKTPALGQALAAASVPVVLTAAQITTLTPPASQAVTGTFWQATQPVSGTFWQATQPVSGTVTASGPVTDAQIRATPLPVSGTITANAGTGTLAVSLASVPSHAVTLTVSNLTGTAASAPTDIIASTDVSGYASGSCQLTSLSGTVQIQWCNDNATWLPGISFIPGNIGTTSAVSLNMTADNMYVFPVQGRYMRVRKTAHSSGTVTANVSLNTSAAMPIHSGVSAAQSGNFTVRTLDGTGGVLASVNTSGVDGKTRNDLDLLTDEFNFDRICGKSGC
jgi:hypothetical protein